MLICPHCEKQVTPKPGAEWFLCPHCELPIRKQVNRNGNAELQPGMKYAQATRILQYLSNKPDGMPVINANPKIQQYNLKELLTPIKTIDERLAASERRQAEIISVKKELGGKIDVLTKNSEQREKFHAAVDKLSNEYEAREGYAQQLLQVKAFLTDERNQAKTDISFPVSVGSILLAIGGLVLFAWAGGVTWDWKTILVSIGIVIATPILMYNVAINV